eukprot:396077-Pleurochrysis_carterae.AAC.2
MHLMAVVVALEAEQDHGIKLYDNGPLESKRFAAVAHALVDIFSVIGALAILQYDNGREFVRQAGKGLGLREEVMDGVIQEVRKLFTNL